MLMLWQSQRGDDVGIKENIKLAGKIFVGILLTVITGGAYLVYRARKRNANPGRIQRGDDIIRDIESGIEASQATNRVAREHAGKAGEHIDSAIESIDNAQAILERAKNRSEE